MSDLSNEFTVTTPIDQSGSFSLVRFDGTEGMSRLFRFDLELISSNTSVDATELVGLSVTLGITSGTDSSYRPFNGIVSRFVAGGLWDTGRTYWIELVPWLWLLTRTTNCQIFQNKTTRQIVTSVFESFGFTDYKFHLSGSYSPREYCVQYRETSFHFISRLLEDEGISYFFSQETGKHVMILIDDIGGYVECDEYEVVNFTIPGREQPSDRIITWQNAYELRSGKYTLTDYDFTKATNNLLSQTTSNTPLSKAKPYELFDYPGGYDTTTEGSSRSKTRIEEDETAYEVVRATSTYRSFTSGGKFKIKQHPVNSEVGQSYAITRIEHTATRPEGYRNRLEAIPANTVFRPPLQTQWPRISGAQTAVVVGASGEEIWPDKYGRIKVMFHWDREAKGDDTSSCWIRCSQAWSGSGWGTLFIPRVGQEVVVVFLEGNPDQPLIAGTVANSSEMPGYSLPANKTRSYIRSHSSKGGASSDTNEIRLEDLKGSEEFYIHAQKDCTRVVENDDTLTVGNKNSSDGSQAITIYKNRSLTIQTGNETVTITQGNRNVAINAGNDSLTVNKTRSLTVQTGNETVSIAKGNRTVTIQAGDDSLSITKGNLSINVSSGSATIEAGQTLTLQVGSSSVVLNQQGVTIKGATISVQGTSSAQVSAPSAQVSGSATLKLSGASTQVSGSGTLALSGGVVNIN